MDPLHAVYAYAQNKLSAIVEDVAQLPMCAELAEAYSAAEEEYLPSGPPMSPLTRSHFFCWAVFDSHVGKQTETLAKLPSISAAGWGWNRVWSDSSSTCRTPGWGSTCTRVGPARTSCFASS